MNLEDGIKSVLVSEEEISKKITEYGKILSEEYKDKNPLFVGILKGSFIFMSDIIRALTIPCEIDFMAASSYYNGTVSTGNVKIKMDLSTDVSGRDVIIAEDIIDTGITMSHVLPIFHAKGAASVKIATMLMKPEKLKCNIKVDYCAMEIPNDFIVGYGLDYDGLGRNYKDIYTVVED
jgi:hypoxanthine phosphoribosyltransferase